MGFWWLFMRYALQELTLTPIYVWLGMNQM
jgi:hypothetical protein